jgi:phosphatidate cytidylyltransferase
MTQPADVTAEPAPEDPAGGSARGPHGEPAGTPPPEPPPRVSRAGRNLPVAIGVGAVLGALVLVTIYRFPPGFVAVLVVAFGIAVAELVTQLMAAGARPPRLPLLAGTAAMVVCAYLGGIAGLAVAYAATVLATVFWRLPHPPVGTVRDVSSAVWIATYVPFLGGFAALMFAQTQGADRIVVFVAATVCSDVGGYAAGVLFGRHPLAPRVSPAKTWEGFAGSVVACLLGGWLVGWWLLDLPAWQGLVLGASAVVVATLGDLAESSVKRDLGVKDMGRLLPGHGGLMDRLDSLLPVAPVAYALLTLFIGA